MKTALVTGSCSTMGRAVCRRLEVSGYLVMGMCRCSGLDILMDDLDVFNEPIDAVIHIAEVGPGGMMRVWSATQPELSGGVFIAFSSIHHLNHDDDYARSKRNQESLVKRLAGSNPKIRVNALRLGHIFGTKAWPTEDKERVKEIPLGRFGNVEEVADAVEFMVKAKWMTGSVLTLDGGISAIL